MTALATRTPARTAVPTSSARAVRDVHAWEARVRRILQPARVELVDGSAAQRHRLVTTGVRRGTLVLPLEAGADLAAHRLDDLLPASHRDLFDLDAGAGPGGAAQDDEAAREAEVMRVFSGVSRGRTLYVVPFAADTDSATGAVLGVQVTDSLVAVLALQEVARVGTAALGRVDAGEPWTAAVHSVGVPLDDEEGQPVRDDVPWPQGVRSTTRLRGGAEVWSCGSPLVRV